LAQYEHLPIYKAAFDLLVYFEKIVRNFSRYNKYTHGTALRDLAREILMLIVRATTPATSSTLSSAPFSNARITKSSRDGARPFDQPLCIPNTGFSDQGSGDCCFSKWGVIWRCTIRMLCGR